MKKYTLLLLLLGFIIPLKAQFIKNEGAKITIGSTSFVRSGEWSNIDATSQTNLFGNLSLTQNLINNGVFTGTGSSSNLFFIGTTLQNVQGTNPFSLYNMQINNAGNNVSLSNSITISNLLSLTNGRLISELAPIFFSSTALNPVETNANRIIGTATMQNRAIGTGSLATFLGASFDAGTDLGNVSLTRKTGTQGIITNGTFTGIAAHWSFTSDVNAARNLTFNWLSDLDNSKNLTQMQLWRSTTTTAAGQWTAMNVPADMSSRSYSYASTNLQRHWSFSDATNPLSSLPEINLQGGSSLASIADGDVTPSLTDNTDFGNVSTNRVVTYTIQNTGAGVLTISSIISSGTNAADFVVGSVPSTVAAGGSATFTVTFTPSTIAVKTATITITNDDADEAVYDFAIRGTGISATPSPISLSAFITPVPCSGGNTGAIDLTVTGGVGASTYAWTFGGAPISSLEDISSLATGEYTVTVTNNGSNYTARYFVGIDLTWTVLNNFTLNAQKELVKGGAANAWDNYASSAEKFSGGGGITFTAFETSSSYMVGLSTITNPTFGANNSFNSIDYAIYITQFGDVRIYEKGNQRGPTIPYSAGDIFRVTRSGTTVTYAKNGVVFYTSLVPTSAELFTTATMYNATKRIPQIQFISCPPITSAFVTPVSCSGGNTGSIDLTVTGGGTYTYLWSNGAMTEDISGLAQGEYSVTITTNGVGYISRYLVGYDLNWTAVQNMTLNAQEELIKGASNAWDGDAMSVERIVGNGGIVFTASETTNSYMVGLSYTNTSIGFTDIGYAIYLSRNGKVAIYQQGGPVGAFGTYKTGDIFRVTRSGTAISYSKNGVVFYTATNVNNADLFANAAMYDANQRIPQVQFTSCPVSLSFAVTTNTCAGSTGSATVSLVGEALPATYLWSDGSTNATLAGKPAGIYSVTATMASAGLTLTKTVSIGNTIDWGSQNNVSIAGNVVTKTDAQGWTSGTNSNQQLSPRADGWVNSTITSTATSYMFGLAKVNTDPSYTSITYAWYVVNGAYAYPSYNSRPLTSITTYSYQMGDNFRVAREGNQVKFYKNEVVVYQQTVNNEERLVADVAIHTLNGTAGILQNSFCGTTGGETYSVVVNNIDCAGTGVGSINVTDIGGFTYAWSNGQTTPNITNLSAGLYTLTLSKAGVPYSTNSYLVGRDLVWTGLVDFAQDGVNLKKVSTTGAWSTNANSTIAFTGNGGIVFAAKPAFSYMIGLSAQEQGVGFTSIDYAIYLTSVGNLLVYENGLSKGTFGTYQAQDVFKVERVGTSIRYVKNGTTFYTSTVTTSAPLLADVSMHTANGVLPQVVFTDCSVTPATKVQARTTLSEEDTFQIYPNPSTGVFNIRFGTVLTEDTQVTILDAIGRKVNTQTFEKGSREFTVNIKNQPKGMYLIHFNQNGATYSKAIVVE